MYKHQFNDEEFTEVDFLKPKFEVLSKPLKLEQPRGIKSVKKEAITKLVANFPAAKRKVLGWIASKQRKQWLGACIWVEKLSSEGDVSKRIKLL